MAGSFIEVTDKESADFTAASAFSLPRIPTCMTWDPTESNVLLGYCSTS